MASSPYVYYPQFDYIVPKIGIFDNGGLSFSEDENGNFIGEHSVSSKYAETPNPIEKLSIQEIVEYIKFLERKNDIISNDFEYIEYRKGFYTALRSIKEFITSRQVEDVQKQIQEENDNCC